MRARSPSAFLQEEARPDILTKTGFMVGLGETEEEIDRLMDDVRETGCDILTIGQYLPPSPAHAELKRYATPEDFDRYRNLAYRKGFRYVASAPGPQFLPRGGSSSRL